MSVNAIRRAAPHAVLAAAVTAAGASAAIFINVGLLDNASPVGNLSPRSTVATARTNPPIQRDAKTRPHVARTHVARAHAKAKVVARSASPPVRTPSVSTGSSRVAATKTVTASKSTSRVGATKTPTTATRTTTTSSTGGSGVREHRSSHEVELERGDD
jgi:hypothetical protein